MCDAKLEDKWTALWWKWKMFAFEFFAIVAGDSGRGSARWVDGIVQEGLKVSINDDGGSKVWTEDVSQW